MPVSCFTSIVQDLSHHPYIIYYNGWVRLRMWALRLWALCMWALRQAHSSQAAINFR